MSRRVLKLLIAVGTVAALLAPGPAAVADSQKASIWLRHFFEYELTPDASHLVYSAEPNGQTNRLYSRNLVTNVNTRLSPLTQIVMQVGGVNRSTPWAVSHDSARVLYRAINSAGIVQLYSVPVGGGQSKRVNALLEPAETTHGVYNFWVSPSSDYVVWVEDQNSEYAMYAAKTDGTDRHRLHPADTTFLAPTPSVGGPWPITFSGDGQRVILGLIQPGDNRSVVEVALAGGSNTVLQANLAPTFLLSLEYTDDGSAVTYFTDAWYFQPLSGGPAVQASPTGVTRMGYSRGGGWMMYKDDNASNQTGDFAIRRKAGLQSFQVGPYREKETYLGTSWTDDTFYYSDNTTFYQVAMVDGATPVATQDISIRSGTLSPDGEYFLGRTTSYYVVPTNPNKNVLPVPDSGVNARFGGFSTNGDRFAFVFNNAAATYDRKAQPDDLDPRNKYQSVTQVQFLANGDLAYVGYRNGTQGAIFVADPYFCDGFLATHVGTNGSDTLTGGAKKDVMVGRGGDDTLKGFKGNDHLCGGGGHDTLIGAAGRDHLFGHGGDDDLRGGNGNDDLNGGPGTDSLTGGPGTDSCVSGETLIGCE